MEGLNGKDGKTGRGQTMPRPLLSQFYLPIKLFESVESDTNSPFFPVKSAAANALLSTL
jgi:hypothetical protein